MVLTGVREEVLSSPRLNDSREIFSGVVVIGGVNIDLRGKPEAELLKRHTSNPGKINVGLGGVGRNIAHNLGLLNVPVYLLSAVGNDGEGIRILEETRKAGVRTEQMIISGEHPTGIYLAILNEKGEMEVAISDMQVLEEITVEYLKSKTYLIKESKMVVIDTNIPEKSIEYVVDLCNKVKVPLLIEPVSVEKAKKLKKVLDENRKEQGKRKRVIDYITPNEDELYSILGAEVKRNDNEDRDVDLVEAVEKLKSKGVRNVIVTLGEKGIYASSGEVSKGEQDEPGRGNFLASYKGEVVDVTGAGDALVAGLVYGIYQGYSLEVAARFSLAAAALTISTKETVRRDLREGLLRSRMEEEKERGRLL